MLIEPSFVVKEPVALGLDVGFSSTKSAHVDNGAIVTRSFPSVAARPSRADFISGMGGLGVRESDVKVLVNGVSFIVDTSDSDVVESSVIRTENDDFPITNEHYALICAALVKCGLRHIDQLVLGLPLLTFEVYASQLISRLRGIHDFGYGRVTINNVSVLPQPLGAYVALRSTNPSAFSNGTSCAIVDSGWGTTDVLVASPTFKIDRQRCGGLSGSAAVVLREIAALLQRQYKGRFNNLDRIDRAIVLGTALQHGSKEIDLRPFVEESLHITVPIARSVLNIIRTPEDLTIFATGGAGHYYLPALCKTLGCDVKLLEQPRFANAVGFLLAGQSACRAR